MEPNKTYELELNKQYKITLGDMSHCGLSHEEMIEHYKSNSSPLSFLLEKLLPKHFTNLVYDPTPQDISLVSGKTIRIKPDLRDKETNTTLYDQKAFNQKGNSIIECDKNYFRPLDVNTLLGDARKARKILKWKPLVNINTLIDEMIVEEYKSLNAIK